MPPIRQLRAAGGRVFAGSDNIRDAWSPLGDGDMLERAMLIAYRQDFRADADLELAFDLTTRASAQVLGLVDHGVKPGGAADLVAMNAGSISEAVAARPTRSLVMKRGRVVARDGILVSQA
jgi:cytosine deaminase